MATYDFFSPFFQAYIIRSTDVVSDSGKGAAVSTKAAEDRYPLFFKDEALTPELLKRAHLTSDNGTTFTCLPYMTALRVEMGIGNLPKISVTLTPPYKEAIALLDSDLVDYGVNQLEVQFGYLTGSAGSVKSPRVTGMMLEPEVTIGTECTIVLHGLGISSAFSTMEIEKRGKMRGTRRELVELLTKTADYVGVSNLKLDDSLVMKPSAGVFITGSTAAKGSTVAKEVYYRWAEEKVEITPGVASAWFTMWQLVRESGLWMTQVENQLRVFPTDIYATQPVACTLKLFDVAGQDTGGIGPSTGIYPIMQVSSPTKAIYLTGLRGMVLSDVNKTSKKVDTVVTGPAEDTTTKSGPTDAKMPANKSKPTTATTPSPTSATDPAAKSDSMYKDLKFTKIEDSIAKGAYYPGNPGSGQVMAQAQAAFKDFVTTMGIHLNITSLGIPELTPGDSVAVEGIGKRYDCPTGYGVFNLVHELSTSGYTTSMELVSDTSNLLGTVRTKYDKISQKVITKKDKAKMGADAQAQTQTKIDAAMSKKPPDEAEVKRLQAELDNEYKRIDALPEDKAL